MVRLFVVVSIGSLFFMGTFNRFEDIEAWKIARELSREIYVETQQGLFSKDFKLMNQINDASGSVMSNIAEGFGRGSRLECIQFLSFAQDSCNETQSQLYHALDRKYIQPERFDYFYHKATSTLACQI